MEKLQPFIDKRRTDVGIKAKTINLSLEVVAVRIFELAAMEWRDEQGGRRGWRRRQRSSCFRSQMLASRTLFLLEEQEVLFRELPVHLLRMASYKVNAGNREGGSVQSEMGMGTKGA